MCVCGNHLYCSYISCMLTTPSNIRQNESSRFLWLNALSIALTSAIDNSPHECKLLHGLKQVRIDTDFTCLALNPASMSRFVGNPTTMVDYRYTYSSESQTITLPLADNRISSIPSVKVSSVDQLNACISSNFQHSFILENTSAEGNQFSSFLQSSSSFIQAKFMDCRIKTKEYRLQLNPVNKRCGYVENSDELIEMTLREWLIWCRAGEDAILKDHKAPDRYFYAIDMSLAFLHNFFVTSNLVSRCLNHGQREIDVNLDGHNVTTPDMYCKSTNPNHSL